MTLEARLRGLPAFPDDMPELLPEDLPGLPPEPDELFLSWLEDAIASGERQPHAMSLVTVRSDATPVARMLIVKNIDDRGYHFSTHRTSRKGLEIAENQRVSMLFFWRALGRQVRVTGEAVALDEATSQRDWEQRPSYTGQPNLDWQRYALVPDEFEFMQAREDRNHTRVEYLRVGDRWQRELVTTPAG